ncbi:MAG: hypothetical protein RL172_2813 [Bacteroidota bacterium]|jgi:hypothetical protein
MRTKTEKILLVLKIIAILGAIGYSIVWGSQLLTLVSSYINPDWAKRTYEVDLKMFSVREQSVWYYFFGMSINIVVSALKAIIWYVAYQLLQTFKLKTPFTWEVERKLESMAYLMLFVWIISSIFWKVYTYYLLQDTGIQLAASNSDEYLFMAGIIYIISQVFKRGIEIEEENHLTV